MIRRCLHTIHQRRIAERIQKLAEAEPSRVGAAPYEDLAVGGDDARVGGAARDLGDADGHLEGDGVGRRAEALVLLGGGAQPELARDGRSPDEDLARVRHDRRVREAAAQAPRTDVVERHDARRVGGALPRLRASSRVACRVCCACVCVCLCAVGERPSQCDWCVRVCVCVWSCCHLVLSAVLTLRFPRMRARVRVLTWSSDWRRVRACVRACVSTCEASGIGQIEETRHGCMQVGTGRFLVALAEAEPPEGALTPRVDGAVAVDHGGVVGADRHELDARGRADRLGE